MKVSINGNEKVWSDIHYWSMALLNDPDWQAEWIGEDSMSNPNIQVQEEINPIKITELDDGKYILNIGQNMVDWLTANKLKGMKDKPITFRFAEITNPDGTLYLANLRSAKVTDIYTPKKGSDFSWEPSFIFHGFRFVEISGLDYKPNLSDFTGKVVYDKMETTGQFETSNKIINQVFKNAYWGIRGNYRECQLIVHNTMRDMDG